MIDVRMWLVTNSNGGILGGFAYKRDAERCKRLWERRYKQSKLVHGVKVQIRQTKG